MLFGLFWRLEPWDIEQFFGHDRAMRAVFGLSQVLCCLVMCSGVAWAVLGLDQVLHVLEGLGLVFCG